MNGPGPPLLPSLGVADFGPNLAHVAEAHVGGRVFLILRRDDPARLIAPYLIFPTDDVSTYLLVHGGDEATRFQNLQAGATHEIPPGVIAELLRRQYGNLLAGMRIRVGACYGHLLRPGDQATAAQLLARELPQTSFEGYHGLVRLRANPAEIRLGLSVRWDPLVGPVIIGPPGSWEVILP